MKLTSLIALVWPKKIQKVNKPYQLGKINWIFNNLSVPMILVSRGERVVFNCAPNSEGLL